MKRILLAIALAGTFGSTQAQLDNVTCPDFTGTDTDGNVWDLSDMLDDGYTVIIDVFATWCGPCLAYAETGALDKAWYELGPDGADKVIVLSVEGDPSTSAADLAGTGGGTIANWNEVIHNPIIDDASIASTLAISYFPTIYKVCPADRKIYEMGQVDFATMQSEVLSPSCAVASDPIDGFVSAYNSAMELCGGDLEVEVMNLGSNALTAFDVEVYAGGTMQSSTPWTGSLSSFQTAPVSVPAPFLASAQDVSFKVVAAGDAKPANDERSVMLMNAPENLGTTFEIEIRTDQYGYETYWQMEDEAGNVVASGGNAAVGINGGGAQTVSGGGYGNNTTVTETVTVSGEGCYTFTIVDDWGDGICCSWGSGYYRIKDASGNVMLEGGQFGASTRNNVRQGQASGVPELTAVGNVNLFPNPASSAVYLQVEGLETVNAHVVITNAMGQVVEMRQDQRFTVGTNALTFDVSELPVGLYNATITNDRGQRTVSFSVAR
jgi:thiol-disulfide isomerase/thioredoxin